MKLRKKIQQPPQVESENSKKEEMSLMARCKTFRIENVRYPQVVSKVTQPNPTFEKKVMKWWLKGCTFLLAFALILIPFNLMINATHEEKVQAMREELNMVTTENVKLKSQKEHKLISLYNEKETKKKAMFKYLERKNASDEIKKLVPLCVEMSYMYDIDPIRPMVIMLLETGFGHAPAVFNNKNIAGINWTEEQKRRIGIRSDIYNLAVEKTVEASLTNLIMLLVDYKNFKKPLITLSQIQTKYAPSDDKRNGLDGMDNTKWTRNTIHHYEQIETIYNELIGGN